MGRLRVLSAASSVVKSRVDTEKHNDPDTTQSAKENEMETASCKCPNCGGMTEITGVYMLAPQEVHSEDCKHCSCELSMMYTKDGDWKIKAIDS